MATAQTMEKTKGRRRKTPSDWAKEYDELEVKRLKSGDTVTETLTCKYCSFEINVVGSGKKHKA